MARSLPAVLHVRYLYVCAARSAGFKGTLYLQIARCVSVRGIDRSSNASPLPNHTVTNISSTYHTVTNISSTYHTVTNGKSEPAVDVRYGLLDKSVHQKPAGKTEVLVQPCPSRIPSHAGGRLVWDGAGSRGEYEQYQPDIRRGCICS